MKEDHLRVGKGGGGDVVFAGGRENNNSRLWEKYGRKTVFSTLDGARK